MWNAAYIAQPARVDVAAVPTRPSARMLMNMFSAKAPRVFTSSSCDWLSSNVTQMQVQAVHTCSTTGQLTVTGGTARTKLCKKWM